MNLQELQKQEKELHEKLSEVREQIRQFKIAEYKTGKGFEVGDKIKYMDGNVEKTGEIITFKVEWDCVIPVIKHHKKDGSLGERIKDNWYSREIPVKF